MLVNSNGNPVSSFKVGSIFVSITNENPSKFLGGTWVRFAKGRTLVGINEDDTDTNSKTNFNKDAETELGSKYLQSHTHTYELRSVISNSWNNSGGNFPKGGAGVAAAIEGKGTSSKGDGDSENIQPCIMVYFWKRTA